MTKTEADKIKKECKKTSTKAAFISAAGGAVPIPGVDIGTDVAILLKTLPKISRRFNLSNEQIDELDDQGRLLVFNAIKRAGAELIGRAITKDVIITIFKRMGLKVATRQVAKYIPFVGSLVSAGISYGAMKIVINMHINQCYNVVAEINGFKAD